MRREHVARGTRPRGWSRRARLSAAGAAFALFAFALTGAPKSSKVHFYADFEDSEIGAVPENMSGESYIVPAAGYMLGVTTHPESAISVHHGVGPVFMGNVLRVSDAGVPEGQGHCEVYCYPTYAAGPGKVSVAFNLRAGKYYGDVLEICVIDNRATPGTGRLAYLRIEPDGRLVLGAQGTGTGYTIQQGIPYKFAMTLDLNPVGPDSWTLRLQDLTKPDQTDTFGPIQSEVNGSQVSVVTFNTTDIGTGTYDLDEIEIGLF